MSWLTPRRWVARALLLATALHFTTPASGQNITCDLAGKPTGKVYFKSLTPKNIYELQRRTSDQPIATVSGTLYMPENMTTPVPAMIITPGSGGVRANQTERWKPMFLKLGMAVFIVDTLGSRGIGDAVSDPGRLSYAADIADSLNALRLLSTDPRIDPKRIGQIGFSRGGAIAFMTMLEPLRQAVLKDSSLRFAAHIAVYAGCDDTYWDGKASLFTGAPILFVMGEKDEAVSNKLCIQYAEKLKTVLPKVETRIYEGAHHNFDGVGSAREYLHAGINNLSCPGREFDPADWSVTHVASGKRYVTFDAFAKEHPGYCGRRGYTIATNPTAAAKAEEDVQRFLAEAFK